MEEQELSWKLNTIQKLYQTILDRKVHPPLQGSYTHSLLKRGIHQILNKIEEECEELVRATQSGIRKDIVWEVADLWYHTLVLLAYHNITPQEIYDELVRRHFEKQKKA